MELDDIEFRLKDFSVYQRKLDTNLKIISALVLALKQTLLRCWFSCSKSHFYAIIPSKPVSEPSEPITMTRHNNPKWIFSIGGSHSQLL
jgi:hypothetical protein